MRVKSLRVKGYKSLLEIDIPIDGLTALIGRNGSGKSSILEALDLLFHPKKGVHEDDFWRSATHADSGEDRADTISIEATFDDLSGAASVAFAAFLQEGCLTVERIFNEAGVGGYYCARFSVPEFAAIRQLPKGHREEFNALADSEQFEGLQKASSKDEALGAMDVWESAHPDKCKPNLASVDFFSRSRGHPDAISTYVTFILIGALEAPEQHLDPGRSGGAIARLVAEVVQNEEIERELSEVADTAARSSNDILEANREQLESVQADVSKELDQFVPGFRLGFTWEEIAASTTKPPRVRISVETSEGLMTDLRHQGQGVQRSLMYAVLAAEARSGRRTSHRSVILAIEEPEAFQHPLSSRVLGRTLTELSGQNYQILYSTHSPYFVQPRAIEGLRLVRRVASSPGPASALQVFSLEEFSKRQGAANDRDDFTRESSKARLEANLESRILEGLFANACVLVEGDQDEAFVRGACAADDFDLDDAGIGVIQTRGKTSMPLVLGFFRSAGVPCYPIFDLDRSRVPAKQKRSAETAITRLLGKPDAELTGDVVGEDMAHWADNMGVCMTAELGPFYEKAFVRVCDSMGYAQKQGRKVAPVLRESLREAAQAGANSESLQRLVSTLSALADRCR